MYRPPTEPWVFLILRISREVDMKVMLHGVIQRESFGFSAAHSLIRVEAFTRRMIPGITTPIQMNGPGCMDLQDLMIRAAMVQRELHRHPTFLRHAHAMRNSKVQMADITFSEELLSSAVNSMTCGDMSVQRMNGRGSAE